ncbi:MAG: zinc ribbon domain-containing protein [Synergistaceae bacterium]|nr:zinc ribbon domain-containing protein [Synergistaceae bacterium]
MFCSNCGANIADGSRFCSKCGASQGGGRSSGRGNSASLTRAEVAGRYSNPGDLLADYNNVDRRTQDLMWKIVIEGTFSDLFNKRKQFDHYGTNIYIIGKDSITREMKDNIGDYYMTDDPEEVPLLVFDYTGKGSLKEGFVITNSRFVFNFGGRGQQEFELRELEDVEVGKALLANVMYLHTVDGVKSDKIFLTTAGDEMGFASTFREFVRRVNKFYNFFNGTLEQESDGGNSGDTDKIIRACHCVQFGSGTSCEVGDPVLTPKNSKKLAKAKAHFRIPDSDDVYFIYDSTVFGSCEHGFAVCSSGVYYSGDFEGAEHLDWDDYEDAAITGGTMSVSINGSNFAAGFSGKKLLMLLQALQQ